MFALSGIFWLVILFILYVVVSYALLYSRVTQEADLDGPCQNVLSDIKEENLKIVSI